MNRKSFALLRTFVFVAFVPLLALSLVSCELENVGSEGDGTPEVSDSLAHGAVDLGLKVKWAAYNVGATSPEEFGNYYAWGEVETKEEYSQNTYLKTSLDVAQELWGDGWRMPTRWEFDELRRKCTWEHTSVNGVKGMKATAENGNSIFFPAGGLMMETSVSYSCAGSYWSATEDGYDAWVLSWYDDSAKPEVGVDNQVLGLLVRPVR